MKGDKKRKEREEMLEAFAAFLAHYVPPHQTLFVGIDPGQEGALGFICGESYTVLDIPTFDVVKDKKNRKDYDYWTILEYFELLEEWVEPAQVKVLLELVPISTGPGRKYADVVVNRGWAMWHLFLLSLGYELHQIEPNIWKKAMRLTTDKEQVLIKARKLFPQAPLTRQQDHNRAEALFLTEYHRSHYEQRTSLQQP
jgi:hypothetical protein